MENESHVRGYFVGAFDGNYDAAKAGLGGDRI